MVTYSKSLCSKQACDWWLRSLWVYLPFGLFRYYLLVLENDEKCSSQFSFSFRLFVLCWKPKALHFSINRSKIKPVCFPFLPFHCESMFFPVLFWHRRSVTFRIKPPVRPPLVVSYLSDHKPAVSLLIKADWSFQWQPVGDAVAVFVSGPPPHLPPSLPVSQYIDRQTQMPGAARQNINVDFTGGEVDLTSQAPVFGIELPCSPEKPHCCTGARGHSPSESALTGFLFLRDVITQAEKWESRGWEVEVWSDADWNPDVMSCHTSHFSAEWKLQTLMFRNVSVICSFLFLQLDILCNEEILGKDHTLKFVVVTRWRFKVTLQKDGLFNVSCWLVLKGMQCPVKVKANKLKLTGSMYLCLPEIAPPAPLQTQDGSAVAKTDTTVVSFLFLKFFNFRSGDCRLCRNFFFFFFFYLCKDDQPTPSKHARQ